MTSANKGADKLAWFAFGGAAFAAKASGMSLAKAAEAE